jgi:hypothetical protein
MLGPQCHFRSSNLCYPGTYNEKAPWERLFGSDCQRRPGASIYPLSLEDANREKGYEGHSAAERWLNEYMTSLQIRVAEIEESITCQGMDMKPGRFTEQPIS